MANSIKKRGQKFLNRFSRVSLKASEEGKEHIKENLIDRFSHIKDVRLLVLEWGLLVLALIMLSVTQAFWFGSSYANDAFIPGGIYTEATLGEISSMNPLFATTNSERTLSRLMFATIATNDYSGNIGLGLAEIITPIEDGRVWTVRLRDKLEWSDGEPITSADVLFTAELIKNPATNSIYDSNLRNVKVYLNEAGEIVFELPSAYADFMTALNFPILPKHILDGADPKNLIEHSFSSMPVTSGAFYFNAMQTGSTAEEKIYYLASNPHYYKGKTRLNGFSIHTYTSKEKIIDALNAGVVTATAELSEADKDKIKPTVFAKNSSLSSGAFIFFNTSRGISKNLALRRAIRQGIDLAKIRSVAPDSSPINLPLLESQIKLNNYPDIPTQNTEEAKVKIDEIKSENDGKIYLDIATVESGYLPEVANTLATELNGLGIETNVSVYEENQEFITNIISQRNYDILIYEIELGADPDLLPYYHSSQASSAGLNLSNYHNSLVDDLLLGARETMDMSLRVRKFESFLMYWVNDVPAIGIYQPNLTYYYNKNVLTFGNNVHLVTALDRFCDISSWAVNKGSRNKTP